MIILVKSGTKSTGWKIHLYAESGKYLVSWRIFNHVGQTDSEWAYNVQLVIGSDGSESTGSGANLKLLVQLVGALREASKASAGAMKDSDGHVPSAAVQLAKVSAPLALSINRLGLDPLKFLIGLGPH